MRSGTKLSYATSGQQHSYTSRRHQFLITKPNMKTQETKPEVCLHFSTFPRSGSLPAKPFDQKAFRPEANETSVFKQRKISQGEYVQFLGGDNGSVVLAVYLKVYTCDKLVKCLGTSFTQLCNTFYAGLLRLF